MVIWSEPAQIDLKSIFQFIKNDSEFYANKVVDVFILESEKLKDFPRIGKVVLELGNENIREIKIYSYRLIYEINSNINILTIIHERRILTRKDIKT